MASGFSLKDDLFNPSTIGDLAAQFRATGAIDADRFEAAGDAREGRANRFRRWLDDWKQT